MKKKSEPKTVYDTGGYLRPYITPDGGKRYIKRAILALKKYSKKYDTIAFRGMSGALFAPELSRKLNKHLILVRKSCKNNHAGQLVEGHQSCKRYIIVDDFIHTGATRDAIIDGIKGFAPSAFCIGELEAKNLKTDKGAKNTKLTPIPKELQ